MFTVTKRIEIAGAHFLNLPYESKCSKLHGHNWIIEVEVSGMKLNSEGMLVDFCIIKEVVNKLDHKDLNGIFKSKKHDTINPTAENIAKWITREINCKIYDFENEKQEEDLDGPEEGWEDKIPCVSKVTVQESEGNTACYIP